MRFSSLAYFPFTGRYKIRDPTRLGWLTLGPMSDPDHRITELEIRLAHSERTVEQLHEVTLLLKGDLDRLARKFEELQERLDAGGPEVGPADDRPPHW